MSVFGKLREANLWLGVGVAALTILLMDAVGAALVCRGMLPQTRWIAYLAEISGGFAGVLMARHRQKQEGITYAVFVFLLSACLTLLLGWLLYHRVTFASYGVLLSLAGGCLMGGIVKGKRKKTGKHRARQRAKK